MSKLKRFTFETTARLGSSVFAGTLVSCLLLGRVEWLHFGLMSLGAMLMCFGYGVTVADNVE